MISCKVRKYEVYYDFMYGLINRAIKDLVIERAGEAAWKRVHHDAGVQEDEFVAMESYSDESTYALIGSASRLLDLPQEAHEMFHDWYPAMMNGINGGPALRIEGRPLGRGALG